MATDSITPDLLAILVCPQCRIAVHLAATPGQESGLACPTCGRVYPIRQGIPVMRSEACPPAEPPAAT